MRLKIIALFIINMSLKKLNYIGSKFSLLSFIEETIRDETNTVDFADKKFVDVFSGTSSVGFHFRNLGCNVISNDLEYYAYIVANASICGIYSDKLKGLTHQLNEVEPISGIFSKNYSEDGEEKRMFFTVENARKIDGMRIRLEEMKPTLSDEEYYFLLGSIIVSADSCANVPSIYGSFLKEYKKTALKDIILNPIHQETLCNSENRVFNDECLILIDKIGKVDWVYLDPPYNERQYGKNYHVLNYIAKYEEQEIYGKTGLIKETTLSDWCSKSKAPKVLDELLQKLSKKTDYVFMSYNNEGIISHESIRNIFEKYFETKVVTKEYRRFKNFNYNEAGPTLEYIWIGKKMGL